MYKKFHLFVFLFCLFNALPNSCKASSADDVGALKAHHIEAVSELMDDQRCLVKQSLVNELNDSSDEFVQIHKAEMLVSEYEEWHTKTHGKLPDADHDYWATDKMEKLTQDALIQYDEHLIKRFQGVINHVESLFLTPGGLSTLSSFVSMPEQRWIVTHLEKVLENILSPGSS